MSEKGTIEISIEDDEMSFSTNLTIPEMNYWLDHIKYLIVSGQAQQSSE